MHNCYNRVWSDVPGAWDDESCQPLPRCLSQRRATSLPALGTLAAAIVLACTSGSALAAGTAIQNTEISDTTTSGATPAVVGPFAIAIGAGNGALALGNNSVAIGDISSAAGFSAVAVGAKANSVGSSSVAMGAGSTAYNDASIAIGSGASAGVSGDPTRVATIAIGRNAQASAQNSMALGDGALASGPQSTAIGSLARSTGSNSVAVGRNAIASNSGTALGTTAEANATRATALGQGAKANVTDATAVGQFATVTAASGVAVGLGALANRTGMAGGNELFSATSVTSGAGALSVGTVNGERQIINVAGGTTDTDAVNVRQLRSVAQPLVGALGGGAAINAATGVITGPTYVLNAVAPDGTVTPQSYSKVGDALSGLDGSIQNVNNAVTIINSGGGITYFRANSTLADASATGANSIAVGPQAVASGASSLALGAAAQATQDKTVALGNNAAANAVNGIALGADSQTSIAGGVALGQGAVSNRVIATSTGTLPAGTALIPYDTTTGNLLGAVSVGTAGFYRQITNVADGTQSQDAVTLRQLQGALSSVAVVSTKYFHSNSTAGDALAVGDQAIAIGPLAVVNADNGIGMGNGAVVDIAAPGGIAIGRDVHVLSASGIAMGTQAQANGIQAMALGAGAAANGALSISVGASSSANAAASVAVGNGANAAGANSLALGTGAQSNQTGDVALGAGSVANTGAQSYTGKYSNASNNAVGAVSVGAVGAERNVSNVADGRLATDAVNVRQLDGAVQQANTYTDTRIATISGNLNGGSTGMFQVSQDGTPTAPTPSGTKSTAGGAGAVAAAASSTALGNGAQSTGTNSVAVGANSSDAGRSNVVSVGTAGGERQVINVAAGVAITDAVNVGQLSAATQGAVQYDSNPQTKAVNYNQITLGNGSGPVTVANVANGVNNNDAVNVQQLNAGLNGAVTQANNYTDSKLQGLRGEIDRSRRDASGGSATAMAVAGLPQPYAPGRSMISLAGSTYEGQQGMAMGVSTISNDGRWVYKAAGTTNTRGSFGAVIGAGYQW